MSKTPELTAIRPEQRTVRHRWLVAAGCLVAGVACLAARWLPGGVVVRVAYGLLIAGILLAVVLLPRRPSHPPRSLPFAFLLFAVVQVLNNSVPGYVAGSVLHQPPVTGNPLASTVSGTVLIQLLETALAVVPILLLVRAAGADFRTIYLRVGVVGKGLAVAFAVFLLFYVAAVTGVSARIFPMREALPLHRFLALTPALVVLALSNGFQEELLFRGLFLQRYQAVFGKHISNVLQAVIFTVAHAGISYTPMALIFLVVVVFPLGLVTGHLMRTTRGMLAPVIFHAGADIPIYIAFLSYVST